VLPDVTAGTVRIDTPTRVREALFSTITKITTETHMLTALTTLFRTTPAPLVTSTVDRITAELHDLPGILAAARAAYSTACLDLAENVPGAAERAQQAATERDRLDRRFDELRAALAAATEREQAATEREAAAEDARRRQVTIGLADQFEQHMVKRLASDIARVAKSYRIALELRERLAASIPRKLDPQHPVLHRGDWEGRMRREFARVGLSWAHPLPFGPNGVPTLEAESTGAAAVVRQWVNTEAE
jgi:hypothetical protein